ncbi:LysR family transcriptional regulator [Sedimentitalea sp. HM32M-2]|uniref:LysR family transcriptional regulator n=1 Tax=Sedimentitalea sp. HM32M-2 TaxID=3351566 RepID=UPI003639A4AB
MDNATTLPDWSLVQSFLAVAETGSLSAAARRLNRSQPTLGRQIKALEDSLGTALFRRHARGLKPTEIGQQLLPMAQQMRTAMNAMTLTAAGRAQRLQGTVRIAASVFASHYLLPPILAKIRSAEPEIQLDLLPSDTTENLLFRQADIAVRMYRPTQLDVVTRHIGDIEMGVFAAHSYLARAGRPETALQVLDHDLIGFDRNPLILRGMQAMGWSVTRDDFAVRCDNQATYWQLLRAGCGIGFSLVHVGRDDPLVQQLELGIEIPPLPVWLAAHAAMRQSPRLRRVWDLLADGLSQLSPRGGSY